MKKWVFGCLGLLLVVGIAAGVATYVFIYKPTRAYLESFAQLKVLPELQKEIRNQSAFTPPASNTLTQAQVDRFLTAQQSIQTRLGTRLDEVREKYRTLTEGEGAEQRKPSFDEIMGGLKELAGLVVDAKRAQVAALNETNFSIAEYEWTRDRVYEATGLPIRNEVRELIRNLAAGRIPGGEAEAPADSGGKPDVPEANKKLVEPHLQELTSRAALPFFGL